MKNIFIGILLFLFVFFGVKFIQEQRLKEIESSHIKSNVMVDKNQVWRWNAPPATMKDQEYMVMNVEDGYVYYTNIRNLIGKPCSEILLIGNPVEYFVQNSVFVRTEFINCNGGINEY